LNPLVEKQTAHTLALEIQKWCDKGELVFTFMEVCGTHTMAIHQAGLKSLFPASLRLVSGPGCPVCVTEKAFIDEAILMGKEYSAAIVTFGDLVRVPGALGTLAQFRAEGGQVRVVYSPMDTLNIAVELAPQPVIFLGVGFETTVPTVALTFRTARERGLENLFCLCAFKTIHQPLRILAQRNELTGFLLPGHVSAIIGVDCYRYLPDQFAKPGVIAGFEPLDILLAVRDLARMAANNAPDVVNDYKRVVRSAGNLNAVEIIAQVFSPCDVTWRGLGVIPASGLAFSEDYAPYDARARFPVDAPVSSEDPLCKCADIITGRMTPNRCPLFGRKCTPENPVGPCMVSSEGTCAAFYKYGAGET